MNDLDSGSAVAFEAHTERFLRALLNGNSIAAITGKEELLKNRAEEIVKLDEHLLNTTGTGILARFATTKRYVFPSDLTLFLLASFDSGMTADADDIIQTITNDHRVMSLAELMLSLESAQEGIPAGWAASVYGELGAEINLKPVATVKPKSQIDLSAMRQGMNI